MDLGFQRASTSTVPELNGSTELAGPQGGTSRVFTLVGSLQRCCRDGLAPHQPPPRSPDAHRLRPGTAICSSWVLGSPPDPLPPPIPSRPSPPRLRRAPPLPPPGAWGSESSQRLPRRRVDTRQIGIGERKGGKAARQPVNKGAIKAAPKCLGEKIRKRTSNHPNLKPEGDAEEGARFPWGWVHRLPFELLGISWMVVLDQPSWLFKLELLMRDSRPSWRLVSRARPAGFLTGANTLVGKTHFEEMFLPAAPWNMTSGLNNVSKGTGQSGDETSRNDVLLSDCQRALEQRVIGLNQLSFSLKV
ncbi:uncharacterized protein LOC116075398 [Mastomys coucha]|uniref:uncharacterized protein LOC116075398 n=1 Tax=Mastomys coucha TaxID=35658 RepID=UPI0012626256|nr:uncharacterized protein LOC116075398 [Mastomys coucha]